MFSDVNVVLSLLSRVSVPGLKLSQEEIAALTHRIQFGGDEVVKAKDGAGSATLSMAWAGAHFARSVARALSGETGITECTFVENDKAATKFFSTPVELGVRCCYLSCCGCGCVCVCVCGCGCVCVCGGELCDPSTGVCCCAGLVFPCRRRV